MKKQFEVDVPETVLQFVRDQQRRKEEERKEAEQRLAAQQQLQKMQQAREEQRRRDEGLPVAQQIVDWAEEFRKSATGGELIKLSRTFCNEAHVTFFDQVICPHGRRILAIFPDGLRWTRSGCGARWQPIRKPIELALAINPEILKAAWASIENGTVWQFIQENFE